MTVEWIAGVDEAGRGPLAGPVVAAAVVLNPACPISGLTDSKLLSAEQRADLYIEIKAKALAWAVAEATVEEIDCINILQATLLAMRRAVDALPQTLSKVLIDGNRCPELRYPSESIIKGDLSVPSISAASIMAKVSRDRLMLGLHQQYPKYEFDRHKGYATPRHIDLLQTHGPCPHHRRTFEPVARLLTFSSALG